MSIEEHPNRAQDEKLRDEIPNGIGYGKQDSTFDTMNELADNLNEEQDDEQQSDN